MSKNEYEIGQMKDQQRRPAGGPGPGGMRMGGEKPKNFKKSIGKLLAYSKKYWLVMIIAFICAIGGAITSLLGPDKLSDITDTIISGMQSSVMTGGHIDLDKIASICRYLVILYVIGAVLLFIQGWIMATVTQRLTNGLRRGISEKINRLPLRYFDNTTIGNTLSRVTNDIDTLGQSLNQSLGQLVTSIAMFLGAIVMMFATNAIMALTAIGSTLIGFVFMSVILKSSQKYFTRNQRYLGEINGHIEEIYAGHNIVKAYNGEKEARRVFDDINEKLYDSNWKSQFFSGLMMPLMNFIGNFGYVAVCVVGAVLTKNGTIDFGVIVAFLIYIRLFTQPLAQVAQAATTLQSTAAASERVFEFLEEKELEDESEKTEQPADMRGDVTFSHVHFGYTPDKTIIKDFSADIKAGQKVAIVGPTGAGKTTIVNLLMRFYEVDSGEILVDGVPTSRLRRENVHDLFCMVLQDTWLFEGTIKENIVYSKQGVTDEEVKNACKAVGLHHFIKTLPHGYDTVLNDNANLSAGQKQLLTIARAMIQNSPLLILDEATSSVDTRTELLVQKAMDELMKSRTSFVIAHRLSTIKNADMILVMRDGDIVESGNHEQLLAKGGFYADLYNSQFEQAS
ncbi:ATP-binding cassette, subfamily B [Sporobacter termitidis DSM 10068]|uniref:ATP-binding cassette, subfamily B n=1 Tax=Sporobacter termitidis DSM 10068 TaxID=1123282 RepID=A0A1M5U6S5_9FIRM|nr:ABC transporter ATP-binding protein [Sporobacter termitidis]SHH58707.1 ATP-binding cassette, subfamily B [Sporobacter termitidis DSM 10068]